MSLNNETKRKGSVTFDLQTEQELLSPCNHTIHLSAQAVPDTMLVALFDREKEMKVLVDHNRTFFLSIESLLEDKWNRFENTLYVPRTQMADVEWITRISNVLPWPFLEKFKDLVGYMGDDDEDSPKERVELARIRTKSENLSKTSYPQFFINCQKEMSKEEYDDFRSILFDTDKMNDELWEKKIRQQLKPWPNVLEQLEEIVAYEIEEE
ncbi:hypothetical protein G6F56_006439 [Rhizopus delemar]|nr:hypothetical protein G6F56_006439 [Rhizopus delemar]